MIKFGKGILKVFWVFLFVGFINVGNVYGQAPDCDICDQILENGDPADPQTLIDYAQCVEDNCDGSIPVDSHIWMVVVAGVAIVYIYYRRMRSESSPKVTKYPIV